MASIANMSCPRRVPLSHGLALYAYSYLAEPMCPGDVRLLEVVVTGFEFAIVNGIDAAKDRVVIAFRDPPNHRQACGMRGDIPGSDIVSGMDSEQHRPVLVQLYRCCNARLRVAIEGEHQ